MDEDQFYDTPEIPAGLIAGLIFWYLLYIIGMWRTFEKAGQPGWAALVPFYNWYVMAKIGGGPQWWFIFIPFLNIYFLFAVSINIAKSFGKGTGFGIGLALLPSVFYIILGFGRDNRYIGPNGVPDMSEDINSIGNNA
jgi:Family of unknown function (DUF5684)